MARWARTSSEERAEATLKMRLCAMRIAPTKGSKLEDEFFRTMSFRKMLLVKAVRHHRIGPYTVDVYVPSRKLVIEVDGRYWHSSRERRLADRRRTCVLKKRGVPCCESSRAGEGRYAF